MSSMFRRLLVVGAGIALLVGLTAGPLSAASKTYTVSVNPSTLTYTGTSPLLQSFAFTFTNTTPSASINSVTISLPQATDGYTITGVTGVTESTGSAGNYSPSYTNTMVTVQNLYPLGYKASVTVTFTASIDTSGLNCTNNVLQWVPAAYNGANLSGSVFTATNAATTSFSSVSANGGQVTVDGVTVTNNSTTCAIFDVSRNGNTVTVLKPTGSTVNLTLDVLWDPEPAVLPLKVDAVTAADGTTTPIQWCGGTLNSLTVPTGQISCLVRETAKVYGPDALGNPQIQVEDVVNLVGDYVLQR